MKMKLLAIFILCLYTILHASAVPSKSKAMDWIVAEMDGRTLSPLIKWARMESTIKACLPTKTKWVQHKTQFSRKNRSKKNRKLLSQKRKNMEKIWKTIKGNLLKEIKKQSGFEKIKDLFTYTATEIDGDNIILTIYFKVPESLEINFDLTCGNIDRVGRESDTHSRDGASLVTTIPKCFESIDSKDHKNTKMNKRFTIPTLKKRYFNAAANNGVRSGKSGLLVGKKDAKFRIKAFVEGDCSCSK